MTPLEAFVGLAIAAVIGIGIGYVRGWHKGYRQGYRYTEEAEGRAKAARERAANAHDHLARVSSDLSIERAARIAAEQREFDALADLGAIRTTLNDIYAKRSAAGSKAWATRREKMAERSEAFALEDEIATGELPDLDREAA